MKLFVLALTLLVSSSLAKPFDDEFENVDIDWSIVRPIVYFPSFWDNKPAELRPPARFFENYERQMKKPGGRIVGGQIAQPHQFPYQAGVLAHMTDGTGFCGGSLIGTRTVLTAAHCGSHDKFEPIRIVNGVLNGVQYGVWATGVPFASCEAAVDVAHEGTMVFGAHQITNANEPTQIRTTVPSSAFVIHPGWNPALIQNDIAVVHLPSPVQLVPGIIRPAILPSSADLNYDFAGEDGVVSGWGVYNSANPVISDHLRYVYDNILTHPACVLSTFGLAQANNICMTGTQNRGACNGDSGGPLTVRRGGESMHVGIVSFGIALGGCENTFPSVFVRTTSFMDWIEPNTL